CAESQRGEDLTAEPTRPEAVPRVTRAVVDPGSGHGGEERELVAGDVDRPSPGPLHPRRLEPGQQPAESLLGTGDRGRIVEERRPDAAAPADRPRGGAHRDAAVRGRAEVVD